MGKAVKPIRSAPRRLRPPRRKPIGGPLDRARAFEVDWPEVSDIFTAARSLTAPSFVYFIGEEEDGPFKIGYAKDPINRLRAMQTGNPRRLRVERVLLGGRHIEGLLHEIWEDDAVRSVPKREKLETNPGTEWFAAGIREHVFCVLDAAVLNQLAVLSEQQADPDHEEGEWDENEMARIVWEAHVPHCALPPYRDEPLRRRRFPRAR